MLGGGSRALVALGVMLGACSLFVPDDDEYVRGSDGADAAANGGVAGVLGGGAGQAGHAAGSGGSGGSGGNGGSTQTGGAAGNGGSTGGAGGSTGGAGGDAGNGGNGGSTGGSGGASCVPGAVTLVPQPSALYLMVDRTSSMSGSEWSAAENGIEAFATGVNASGSLALQYFPTKLGGSLCSTNGFEMPEVAMAPLPGVANAIAQSLSSTNVAGSSGSLTAAVEGGLDYALSYAASHENEQVGFVLLTDYSGSDLCGGFPGNASGAAANAAHADPPVRTHVVTFGTFGNFLYQLADAGETEQPFEASSPAEVVTALTRASRPCRFSLPASGTPGPTATLGSGPSADTLTEASSAAACQNDRFFLSGSPPTALVLCPDVCDDLSPNAPANVQMDVTCP